MKYVFFNYCEFLDSIKVFSLRQYIDDVWLSSILTFGFFLWINIASAYIYFDFPMVSKKENTDLLILLIVINIILYFIYGWRKRYKDVIDNCLKLKQSVKTVTALVTVIYSIASLYVFYIVKFA